MKVEHCKDLQQLINKLLENTNANELSDTLGLMLEVYLQYAPVEKADLANTTSLIYRLNKFFFNLEILDYKTDSKAVPVDGEKQQCMHN